MSIKNKLAKVFAGAVVALVAFGLTGSASAVTAAQLMAIIPSLTSEQANLLAAAFGGSSSTSSKSAYTHTTTLRSGSKGAKVTELQMALNSVQDPDIVADGSFGPATAAAVRQFQTSRGLGADGVVGPNTGVALESATALAMTPAPSNDGDDDNMSGGSGNVSLSGGAGSIQDADFDSKINNEDVGEDEEDVAVLGLEIEADDSSDIMITAVSVTFVADPGNSSGSSDDFEDYASEVAISLDGEVYARVDGDEFNDDNNYSKTLSLDKGAVIEADEIGDLVVHVSGISNLDSDDEGAVWSVEVESVRFLDASGAIITENSQGDIGGAKREFTFETFASAADTEFKITKGDDNINDARVIDIDDTDDTDNVELLSFEVEIEGDSDIELKELPINFIASGVDLEDAISSVQLVVDGDEIGSESITQVSSTPGPAARITFEDLDFVLSAGDTYTFVVTADVKSLDDGITEGDTLSAELTQAERDLIDAEDESGEDLDNNDKTGTAVGEAHSLYDNGIMVEFVSSSNSKSFNADEAGELDRGSFSITFEITAFGDDLYVDKSTENDNGSNAAGQGLVFDFNESGVALGAASTTAVFDASDTESQDTADVWYISEDDTRRFTLTVEQTASSGGDGSYQLVIDSINWGTSTAGNANANYYTFNLDEFKTNYQFLNSF